jgi:hypothetical protein
MVKKSKSGEGVVDGLSGDEIMKELTEIAITVKDRINSMAERKVYLYLADDEVALRKLRVITGLKEAMFAVVEVKPLSVLMKESGASAALQTFDDIFPEVELTIR